MWNGEKLQNIWIGKLSSYHDQENVVHKQWPLVQLIDYRLGEGNRCVIVHDKLLRLVLIVKAMAKMLPKSPSKGRSVCRFRNSKLLVREIITCNLEDKSV